MVGGRFRDILFYPSTQKIATLLEHCVPCLRRKSPSPIALGQRCDIDCNLTAFRTEHKVPPSQSHPSASSCSHALMLPPSSRAENPGVPGQSGLRWSEAREAVPPLAIGGEGARSGWKEPLDKGTSKSQRRAGSRLQWIQSLGRGDEQGSVGKKQVSE